ncbi:MAG: ABC transporter permease [Acidobacteria bacterium]|nr:ABC transporter permease [Acidobacteriota bacterium]
MLRSTLLIAWKVLTRRKFFAGVSLFGIAFTLGVLTVAAALFDQVVGARPPEVNAHRTIGVYSVMLGGEHMQNNGPGGYALFDRFTRGIPNVELMSIHSMPYSVFSYQGGSRRKLYFKKTDGEFWNLLRFDFLEGGPYTEKDVAEGRFLAVINEATRERYFAGGPAVGKTLEADGQTFTVAGVVPNLSLLRFAVGADVWVPHTTSRSTRYRLESELIGGYTAFYLARSKADIPGIQAEFVSRMKTVPLPSKQYDRIVAVPETVLQNVSRNLFGNRDAVASSKPILIALALFTVAFMVLPTLNLVNLTVSRTLERSSEIGVRRAFGASRGALVWQFLVENVFLTFLGAAFAFVFAGITLAVLNRADLLPYMQLELNARVMAVGLFLALFFGVFSGAYPAYRLSRLDPVTALRGGAH